MQQLDGIIDGFNYSGAQRRSVNSYYSCCLSSMDTLRRAAGYVPKIYTVPVWALPTQPNVTVQQQLYVPPGSYLTGISNSMIYTQGSATSGSSFHLYLKDEGTGFDVFSGLFIRHHEFRGNNWPGATSNYQLQGSWPSGVGIYGSVTPPPYRVNPLLSQPYLVSGSGLLTAQIAQVCTTPTNLPQGFQFIFTFACPLNPLTETHTTGQ